MTSSFTILRVRGIPIGVHWSWLLIFAIFVWSLTTLLFPAAYPGGRRDRVSVTAHAHAAQILSCSRRCRPVVLGGALEWVTSRGVV
jgi:Zn-dependent protease